MKKRERYGVAGSLALREAWHCETLGAGRKPRGLQAVLRATQNAPALIGNQLNTESLGQAAASFGRQL